MYDSRPRRHKYILIASVQIRYVYKKMSVSIIGCTIQFSSVQFSSVQSLPQFSQKKSVKGQTEKTSLEPCSKRICTEAMSIYLCRRGLESYTEGLLERSSWYTRSD